MKKEDLDNAIFSLGNKSEKHFTGEAYVQVVFNDEKPLNTLIGNVTFAPGARNHWHSHKKGQVLLITNGKGWYQEEGKPAQLLKKGDVLNIPPNIKHWHGAAKDSWFVHLAMTPGTTDWFNPVTNEWYDNLNLISD